MSCIDLSRFDMSYWVRSKPILRVMQLKLHKPTMAIGHSLRMSMACSMKIVRVNAKCIEGPSIHFGVNVILGHRVMDPGPQRIEGMFLN